MIVAVTGATGFIGQHLCRQLSRAGHETRALVRAPSATLDGMCGVGQRVIGDLVQFMDWPEALKGRGAFRVHQHGEGAWRGERQPALTNGARIHQWTGTPVKRGAEALRALGLRLSVLRPPLVAALA
jgi:uncharacterized protein YbjT (DUF2867 family)